MKGKRSNNSIKIIRIPIIIGIISILIVSCSRIDIPIEVNRNNPENVLRAYFMAWERGEWQLQLSMMDEKYLGMAPEPVKKIDIISIKPIVNYFDDERNYRVIFDIEVYGQGVSMSTGRYDWNYYMKWNDGRKSWIIINYGVG